MPGFSDFSAQNAINWETGYAPMPTSLSRFLALFTVAPSDAGTGGTEVSGTGYARVQVAGALAAGASFTTASTTLTLGSSAPAWLLALGTNGSGVNVYDVTSGQQIGTVASISGVTVTLTGTAAHNSSGSTDSLQFSAWPAASASSGAEPATLPANVTNGAQVNYAVAGTGGWGTVLAWGIFDAITAGNYITGDYLGNNKWLPFTSTSASPGVFTSPAHGYANGAAVVVTSKYGGTLPTTGGSFAGALTVAGVTTDTFNVGVNTTSTGDGQVRQITQQSIPAGVTTFFNPSNLTLTAA